MTAQAGDIFSCKQTLRRELRARRLSIPLPQRRRAAHRAAEHAMRLLQSRQVRSVALYLAAGSELSTIPLRMQLHRAGIVVAAPRIVGDGRMAFERLSADTPLRRRRHGILEAARKGRRMRRAAFDLIVVPLLGFDRFGGRLGAGGGYYDRWLARPRIGRRPLYLGYAYAVQEVECTPREAWDIKLDAVITEQGMRWLTG